MSVTFGLPILAQFTSDPWFILWYPWLLLWNISIVCHCWFSTSTALERTRVVHKWGVGVRDHTGGKKMFADVRAKLFLRTIYCAKPRPDVGSQYGFWSCRGLGNWYPRIICEYDIATAILIQLLIQPHTCKMGSFILLPWANSNSQVQPVPPSLAYNQQK